MIRNIRLHSYLDCSRQDESLPASLLGRENVRIVEQSDCIRGSGHRRYLINHSFFPSFFIRRRPVVLNTWLGTPLKKMGTDAKVPLLSTPMSPKSARLRIFSARMDLRRMCSPGRPVLTTYSAGG